MAMELFTAEDAEGFTPSNYSARAANTQNTNIPKAQRGAYQRSGPRRQEPTNPRTIPDNDKMPPQMKIRMSNG